MAPNLHPMMREEGCDAGPSSWGRPLGKEGAGPDDLARDRYACIQESRVPYGTSYGALSATSTSTGAGWGSRAGVAQGGSSGGLMFLGAARHAQSEANRVFDACMEARGWR